MEGGDGCHGDAPRFSDLVHSSFIFEPSYFLYHTDRERASEREIERDSTEQQRWRGIEDPRGTERVVAPGFGSLLLTLFVQ